MTQVNVGLRILRFEITSLTRNCFKFESTQGYQIHVYLLSRMKIHRAKSSELTKNVHFAELNTCICNFYFGISTMYYAG